MALGGMGLAQAAVLPAYSQSRLPFLISLAEWSLHRALQSKELTHLDFPKVAKEQYGLAAVELVSQFFADKVKDRAYLSEFKRRADGYGVKSLLIMVDGEGALGDPDNAKRRQAVEHHYPWLEAASRLGCHSIRVNAATGDLGSQEEQMAFACRYGMNVLVENHGGLSSNGAWLAGVVKRVGLHNCGTLPDFGNFDLGSGQQYDPYRGVAEMMPFAKAVSAKTYDFDAQGNETRIDYRRMMNIVLSSRYCGYVGIEYEGDRLAEPAGIRATKRLLETIRAQSSDTTASKPAP
jgi:sugar phosphate isomerase/epimerase